MVAKARDRNSRTATLGSVVTRTDRTITKPTVTTEMTYPGTDTRGTIPTTWGDHIIITTRGTTEGTTKIDIKNQMLKVGFEILIGAAV